MPTSFISEKTKHILAVPFLYAFFSRYEWPRGFFVNAATSWVPGLILVLSLTGAGLFAGVWTYLLGYITFICVYEIGYIANDSYGLKHDVTPRKRLDITVDPNFFVTCVALRILTVAVIITKTGIASHALFWVSYAVLVILLVLHNTLHQVAFKFATFLQLSVLRFVLPVLPALLLNDLGHLLPLVAITGMITFTYPRFLTYLEAKGRLVIPERKLITFPFLTHLVSLPFLALIAFAWGNWAPLSVLSWLLFVQCIYIGLSKIPALGKLSSVFQNQKTGSS